MIDKIKIALKEMPADTQTTQWMTLGKWAQLNYVTIREALELAERTNEKNNQRPSTP